MDVSIIIVNYNTKDLTKKCIESVIKYTTNILYEIILVDNASMDGSKELFEKEQGMDDLGNDYVSDFIFHDYVYSDSDQGTFGYNSGQVVEL